MGQKFHLCCKKRNNYPNSRNAAEASDTIVIVPLVKENENMVNNYVEARMGKEVDLKVRTAGEYRRMQFTSASGKLSAAENHALRLMQLSTSVYGDSSFRIQDKRLFSHNVDTAFKEIKVKFSNDQIQSLVYVETCIDVTSWSCPYINDPVYCKPNCDRCWECRKSDQTTRYCSGYWDDGGGSSGGGSGGTGETGGGGSGTGGGGTDPCDGGLQIVNGVLPPNPCDEGGGGPGWIPEVEDDVPPIPPFIWSYNGEDDGKVVVDNYPNNKPTFQFLPTDNYESKYPRFTELVKNLKSFTMSNKDVFAALKKWSGLSEDKILEYLSFGEGPIIKVGPMGRSLGNYNATINPAILNIKEYYVNILESTPSSFVKKPIAFLLAVTILHEFVHFGNHVNGISEGAYEFGTSFEKEAFNVVVNTNNLNDVFINFVNHF